MKLYKVAAEKMFNIPSNCPDDDEILLPIKGMCTKHYQGKRYNQSHAQQVLMFIWK